MLSNVQAAAAAGHLQSQQAVEQQHQTALAQLASMSSAVAAATADSQQRHFAATSAALSAANNQLFNDFRNAEQMRKERDEGAKQLEAQQRQVNLCRMFINLVVSTCKIGLLRRTSISINTAPFFTAASCQ